MTDAAPAIPLRCPHAPPRTDEAGPWLICVPCAEAYAAERDGLYTSWRREIAALASATTRYMEAEAERDRLRALVGRMRELLSDAHVADHIFCDYWRALLADPEGQRATSAGPGHRDAHG